MRSRVIIGMFPALLLAILAWWRWDLIWASIVSCLGFIVISLRTWSIAGQHWSSSLLEYWVAAATWLGSAALLTLWIARGGQWRIFRSLALLVSRSFAKRAGLAVMLLMAFVGLSSPFLVPVDPAAQGDLSTTRLLRPMARGEMKATISGAQADGGGENGFARAVSSARRTLVARTYVLRGDQTVQQSTENEPVPQAHSFCFVLGTDDVGRDVLSRVVSGTRMSLLIGGSAAAGAVIMGALVGLIAGMSRKFIDSLLMRFTDLFLAVPSIILVIALVAFMGQSLMSLVAVLSLTGWMSTARIVRGEVHVLREKEFIAAAKLLGTSPLRIMVGHLLPNVWPILATSAVLQFGSAMLGEAALSFLGLGVQAPTASWGNMIGESISYVSVGWWVGLFPGILLSGAVLATHVLVEE